MTRIEPIDRNAADGPALQSLTLIKKRKLRPNNFLRTLGHAPAAVGAYMVMNEQLAQVQLGTRLREMIALAVSEFHACGYCLSAHVFSSGRAGLDADTIAAARSGQASDQREQAAIALALALVKTRGHLSSAGLDAA